MEFPEQFSKRLRDNGLETDRIVLEVTEGVLVDKPAIALDTLTRFRIKGFNLSIDDLGTGYSSLHRLQTIPFTELKIDKSFVNGADMKSENWTIVENTINLAHQLGLTVVAEGIETQSHWDLLSKLGCNEFQGWFIGKPMPGVHLSDWFKSWQ